MKNTLILFLWCSFIFASCNLDFNQNQPDQPNPDDKTGTTDSKKIPPFEVEFPDEYKILTQASGDLTGDLVDEKVLVLNTGQMSEMGEERVLLVFQVENDEWKMIHRAAGPIMPSEHGGVMGDPLQSVSVENGAIVINHFGGSRSKWDKIHRFKYHGGKWDLVKVTLIENDMCVEQEKFDYNLVSGRVVYSHVRQVCDNGNEPRTREILSKAGFVSKMKILPQMNGFEFGKIHAFNPRTNTCIPRGNCIGVEPREEEPINNDEKTTTTTTEPPVVTGGGTTTVPTTTEPNSKVNENLIDLTELVGIYTASGNDQSWILTIFQKQDDIEVAYYEVQGLLDDIELIIEGYTPQLIEFFEVDGSNNSIDGYLGKGKYSTTSGRPTITLLDKKDKEGNPIVLQLDESYGF